MIDEKKLIAKLEDMAKESKEESGLKEPALLQKIIEEVKDMAVNEEIKARIEREDASGRWIPVTERLPDNNKEVLVTISGSTENYTSCDWHNPDGGGQWDVYFEDNVIAWMPMPEPYRGERDDENKRNRKRKIDRMGGREGDTKNGLEKQRS